MGGDSQPQILLQVLCRTLRHGESPGRAIGAPRWTMVGTTGVRFNPFRKMLVSANLLFALTEAGLRDRVTPVISVDYAF